MRFMEKTNLKNCWNKVRQSRKISQELEKSAEEEDTEKQKVPVIWSLPYVTACKGYVRCRNGIIYYLFLALKICLCKRRSRKQKAKNAVRIELEERGCIRRIDQMYG